MSTASSGQGNSSRMRWASAKPSANMNASLASSSKENRVRKRRAFMAGWQVGLDHGRRGTVRQMFAQTGQVQVELNAGHHQPAEQRRGIGGVMLAVEIEHGFVKSDLRAMALAAGRPFDVQHGNGRIVAHF